jgi:hypothetical protein
VHAQQYVEGYLLKAPEDTIRVLVLEEDGKKSPKEFHYKSSADAAPHKVHAGEVPAFHLNPPNVHFTANLVAYQLYHREVSANESHFF